MVIGFPLIPDEYKPGALWIWNRIRGVDPDKPETQANVITGASDLEQLYAFLHYPLDLKPQHPSACFPLTYRAHTRGFYMFRNRWRDGDDILFQLFAKQTRIGGHSQANAGALRLYGFGKEWILQNGGRDSPRFMDSVVVLPENLTQEYGTGNVTSWGTDTNGSGHVTVDLAGVYAPGKPPKERKGPVDPRTVKKPEASRTVDPNLKGLRAVAVDYSGACGAAALIAIVDRIEGGGRREWLWNLPATVGADGRSFEIAQDDASLKATFLAPGKFELKSADNLAVVANASEDPLKPTKSIPGLTATAAAGENYFVVLTLQRGGPAPDVRVESGEGLASVVRVGKSTVRFDGAKVVIEN
jgi:hypothetical protein